ncbi:neurotrypsin-like [Pomacea canaliculata]|uniref:neurotrypsin-like n=1 Tax=Pomacea canaliculata TaxID=400727 RepID=UPI000D736C49|nr:neurotrypsin-like [Pomacea canaliculata]
MSCDVCQDYILCTNSPVNVLTNSSRCPLMEETDATLQCVSNYSVDAQSLGRLMNGTAPWNGRLEMFYKRRWRKVCARRFTKQEAQVVCRMLGFNTSQVFAVDTNSFDYKLHLYYLFLDGLSCTGEETSLQNCSHSRFYVDTYCSAVVAITCNTGKNLLFLFSCLHSKKER